MSNHLSCLRGCGIVVALPEGRQTRYEISDPHLTRALEALVDVVLAVDDGRDCEDDACDVPLCCGTGAGASSARPAATSSDVSVMPSDEAAMSSGVTAGPRL